MAVHSSSLQEGFSPHPSAGALRRAQPSGCLSTKAFPESSQNPFPAITRKMQAHEGNSGEISEEELQLLPCWCTKPDDNTWKLEAQTEAGCSQPYTEFAVISPTCSSHSEPVGISWSSSLKRLLTGDKMTDKVLWTVSHSTAMHTGENVKGHWLMSLRICCFPLWMFFHFSFISSCSQKAEKYFSWFNLQIK